MPSHRLALRQAHWHTSRTHRRQRASFDVEGLERTRAHSDPVPRLAPRQQLASGTIRGDSDEARAGIGNPWLGRHVVVSTAPKTSCEASVERGSPAHAQTPTTLTPSAGPMQIALKPRLSHQHMPTPVPTQHATSDVSHKSAVRHMQPPSLPRLTINIPQNQPAHGNTVVEMATSLASPPPTRNTSLPCQKRVTFTREQPEIIPQPSKRRQSSVNQRPSWSSVFLLRDSKVRDDVAARSRSLSPGPSILKEFSAFKTDASDAQLKQDEHGNEQKVHISPLWEKNLKRLPRGRQTKKNALPIPQAKVSRNASTRTLSPEDASPRDVSPATLSARHASPREDTFDKSMNVVVHPPSPPESDAEDDDDDDEEVIDDSDESPRHSRNASLEEVEEIEEIDNRFGKIDIDGSSHAHRHEKRDSMDSRKDSQSSRKDSQGSGKGSQEWRESRKSSYGSRRGSQASRKDSKGDDSDRPPPPRRRSSSADQAEMWLRRSSIYGVRSKAPRLPTRLGTMRA